MNKIIGINVAKLDVPYCININSVECGWHLDCNDCKYFDEIIKKLYHYEELEEQGRLIKLPCKVGDTVWIVRGNVYEAKIDRIVLSVSESNNFINLDVSYEYVEWFYNDGRKEKATALCRYLSDAFLTKEEAEAKLAELGGKYE